MYEQAPTVHRLRDQYSNVFLVFFQLLDHECTFTLERIAVDYDFQTVHIHTLKRVASQSYQSAAMSDEAVNGLLARSILSTSARTDPVQRYEATCIIPSSTILATRVVENSPKQCKHDPDHPSSVQGESRG